MDAITTKLGEFLCGWNQNSSCPCPGNKQELHVRATTIAKDIIKGSQESIDIHLDRLISSVSPTDPIVSKVETLRYYLSHEAFGRMSPDPFDSSPPPLGTCIDLSFLAPKDPFSVD